MSGKPQAFMLFDLQADPGAAPGHLPKHRRGHQKQAQAQLTQAAHLPRKRLCLIHGDLIEKWPEGGAPYIAYGSGTLGPELRRTEVDFDRNYDNYDECDFDRM